MQIISKQRGNERSSLVGEGGVVDAVLVVHAWARVHATAQHCEELGEEPGRTKKQRVTTAMALSSDPLLHIVRFRNVVKVWQKLNHL